MTGKHHFQVKRYSVAVLAVGLALLVTLLLQPIVKTSVFAFFYAAVAISAWYGGMKPGLLATILSSGAIAYFLTSPSGVTPEQIIRLGVFVFVTSIVGSLNSQLRRSKHKIEQALTELAVSEKHYRRIVETANEGIWSIDAEMRTTYLNAQMSQMLGYSIEETMGRSFLELIFPEDIPQAREIFDQTKQKLRNSFNFRFRRQDGSVVWFRISSSSIFDESGNFVGMLGMFADMTEVRQQMQEAEAARKTLEALMTYIPEGITIGDETVTIRAISKYGERLALDPPPKPIGMTIDEYIERWNIVRTDGVTRPNKEELPMFRVVRKGEIVTNEEWVLRRPTGEQLVILCNAGPIRNADGEVTGGIVAWRNITERKQIETALRESESRLRLALKAANAGTWDWDLCNNQVTWSEEYCLLYGLDPKTCQPSFENWLNCIYVDDRDRIAKTTLYAITEGEVDLEFRIYHPEGIRWLQAKGQVLYDSAGKPRRMLGITIDITQQKRVEEALRRSEERFRIAQELSLDGFAVLKSIRNTQGEIVDFELTYVNPSGARMVGTQAEDAIGKRLLKILPGHKDHCELFDRYVKVVETGLAHDIEFYYQWDGITGWFRNMAVKLEDGVAVSFSDITDRKQTEAALRESQELFDRFMSNSPARAFIKDSSGRYIYVNSRNEQSFNINLSDWIGKTDFDFFPEDLAAQLRETDLKVLATNQPLETLETLPGENGDRYVMSLKFPLQDGASRPMVAGMAIDVTDRIQAETALRQSEARLQLALKVGRMGIWDWDMQTNSMTWSEAHFTILGLPANEWEASYELWASSIHPDDLVVTEAALRQAMNTKTEYHHQYRTVWPDGSIHWAEVRGQFSYDDREQPLRMIGAIVDITDRKKAEQEREQLLERERIARTEAETANRIKDEFLAVLSHELRSPLNPILGWTKLLRTGKLDEAKRDRALETIERNAKLQTQLIEDLLDVSRILRGKLSLNIYPVNLVSTIEAAIETVRLSMEAKSIQIETFFAPDVGQVLGDVSRLQQVVWNLLSNAVKFTPEGGRIEVNLSVEQGKGEGDISEALQTPVLNYAQIQVKDTGKGIKAEFLPFVFDYFRQADSSITRNFGGLGLGLAIVRHLVELHGGTVWAESPGEGLGATFTVRLPLMTAVVQSRRQNPGRQETASLVGVQVLAVDDDADMREYVAFVLQQAGAKVRVAGSAAEVLDILKDWQPDILVADIGMPNVDGYTLLSQIRAMSSTAGIPAIALTAYASEYDRSQAMKAGFQLHLPKPIEPEILVRAIANLTKGNQKN